MYLYFLCTRTSAISNPKLVAVFVTLWVSFFLSWVIQVQAGQTWETSYLVANCCVFTIGTDPSGKILAGIQQSAAISPWFYGQKDEGNKLFYFSTKASYHWDYAHHYYNNSSVVKTFEAYKIWRRLMQKAATTAFLSLSLLALCSFYQTFAQCLEEKGAKGRLVTTLAELSCPPSPTAVSVQHGSCWLLVTPLTPMLCSQQELAFASSTSSN